MVVDDPLARLPAPRGPETVRGDRVVLRNHAAIYRADPDVGAVYHIHHKALWKALLGKVPTTPEKAEFGTPEMALSLQDMLKKKETREERIAVMHGHEDGIIFWGKDPDEAGKYLLSYYNLIA